jgi:trigger factor
VHSVKVKELPEIDDEFAQSASEFDTLGELRAGTRSQLERVKRMQQAAQARERALDALLARVDVPLPDSMVASEVEMRGQSLDEQLERAGATRDAYLEASGMTAEQLAADMENTAKRSVKASFVLDKLAASEELGVEQSDLNNFVIEQAYRMGVQPDRLAKELADHGQIGSVVSEVLRAKALSLIAERAAVTDEAGRPVDLEALAREQEKQDEDEAEDALEAAAQAALVAAEEAEVAEDLAEEAEELAEEAEEEAEAAAEANAEAAGGPGTEPAAGPQPG